MSWLKVGSEFSRHPKTVTLSDAALRLWLLAACWAREPENSWLGGRIPTGSLVAISQGRWPKVKLARLVAELTHPCPSSRTGAGLWESRDDGWQIHDWDVYNPADALTRSDVARRAGLASVAARRASRGTAVPVGATNMTPNMTPNGFGRHPPNIAEHGPPNMHRTGAEHGPPNIAEHAVNESSVPFDRTESELAERPLSDPLKSNLKSLPKDLTGCSAGARGTEKTTAAATDTALAAGCLRTAPTTAEDIDTALAGVPVGTFSAASNDTEGAKP